MNRRHALELIAATLMVPSLGRAAPESVEQKRLQNRIELWHNYAKRTQNLLARITTTRETSLLESPLVVTGTLAFGAPSTLVLQDDGLTGSTTRITAEQLLVLPNRAEAPPGPPIDRQRRVAADWLADRLVRLFAPGEPEDLTAGCRTNVPRGRGYRLELMPPRGSQIRKGIRNLAIAFDPVAGAVVDVVIAEAQGDRLRIQITDHRQNVPATDIEAVLAQVDELVATHRQNADR